ncbi:DNA damage-induced apoptosis suppressor protein [Solea solea]|uniref:DNA damage-induced apoptosis suppressor protein n=1 Tax=Solea solea TaxID=90069 RepID=UPI00272A3649|nr:DNA damage-induced apoptosis suppressor protein [Solea solea]
MSARRALVSCAVLCVKDTCVIYPCCKSCFSRIDVDQRDTTRCRCSRCGYSCHRELVDYRYRLSLRVTRDRCIFGVTVFGSCLNPFFGVHAGGLQRLVENKDGPVAPSVKAKLLINAVEDCFIGKHFIFGLKVSGTDSGLCFGESGLSDERVQFIASQMILPKAAGLGGCTVLTYYQLLLQKAAEYEPGSSNDPGKTFRPPETPLRLIPYRSPARSFNNATFSASGLLSISPQGSQDCTLTPTPPWQQSLGLVTSSAEQDEGSISQDNGDENSRQTDDNKTTHGVPISYREKETVTEERNLSPPPLEHSPRYSPSFANHPYTSIEEAVENGPLASTWFSPSQPSHKLDSSPCSKAMGFSTTQSPKMSQSSSVVWEDLPFSESFGEFLCEEYKHFDMEPHPHVQTQSVMVKNDPETRSQHKNLSIQSHSVHQSSTQVTESHSSLGDIDGLSEQMCKKYVVCVNESKDFNQEDKEANSLSFETKEEQLEGDTYDCSLDLFSSSLPIDEDIMTINTHAETPDKLRSRKSFSSLIPTGIQHIDFIPPAQSTPVLKVNDTSGLEKLKSKNSGLISSPLSKLSANQLSHFGRESTKENLVWSKTPFRCTPKGRFRKPIKQTPRSQIMGVQAGALNLRSPVRTSHKCDSSVCDVTACGCENSEVMVPPTPVSKTPLNVKLSRRSHNSDLSSSRLGSTCRVNCKRNLLEFHLSSVTASGKQLAQTGNCGTKSARESRLDGSDLCDDENQTCDWSRDLFSDSA